jgi:hypothetical protein
LLEFLYETMINFFRVPEFLDEPCHQVCYIKNSLHQHV